MTEIRLIRATLLAAAFSLPIMAALPLPAAAGQIEQACATSDRGGKNTRVCTCIQRIADQLLTAKDQRLAASFFKDPHKAQEVRQSDRSNDERFWVVYKQFGALAEQSCR
ncbi:hypothetical protein [Meridianimarinicoccus aquatilis]